MDSEAEQLGSDWSSGDAGVAVVASLAAPQHWPLVAVPEPVSGVCACKRELGYVIWHVLLARGPGPVLAVNYLLSLLSYFLEDTQVSGSGLLSILKGY